MAFIPGLGEVEDASAPIGIATSDYFDQDERPEFIAREDGLRIILERIPGLTKKGVLSTRYLFTVPPLNNFSRTRSHSHTEYETLSAGQFSRPGGRELMAIQFETMFVAYKPNWGLVDEDANWNPNPRLLTWELEDIVDSGTPFVFTAYDPVFPQRNEFRMWATLRSIEVDMRAGEDDARYINVSFREFRDPTVIERGRKKAKGHTHRLPTTVEVHKDGSARELSSKGKHGTLIPGKPMTLALLAKHFYGETSQWRKIVAVNGHLKNWPQNTSLGQLAVKRYRGKLPVVKIPRLGGS